MAPRKARTGRRVMAQVAMVMNLDKCIGCHTCSVTCKQVWSNREGTEYVWFNNVETRPGQGYPRTYEDQERWKGGWERTRQGRLRLRSGSRAGRLGKLFANPDLPGVEDYYEPWTYEYKQLLDAPAGDDMPTARPVSQLTGEPMDTITWGPNWDDDLGGASEHGDKDPVIAKLRRELGTKVRFEFEQSFMFYLPRICEHCLNPACVAACPSGAMYKREEDGIVLVGQDQCRGWRMCVSSCPYKKVYFNHATGKAEKCTFCYPRIEAGQPTVCSETCVGRMRYLGVMLYDPDKVLAAASVADDRDLYPAQLDVFLDPHDPDVVRDAAASGIAPDWIEAARNSPVRKLICEYQVALPLHPEYRTMPMVWYIPPLSPVVDALAGTGFDGEDAGNLFGAIESLRIPVEYLAELLTAGDTVAVDSVLRRLAAMRSYMRGVNLRDERDADIAGEVGLTAGQMEAMFRLLAIAKYEDRYVVPSAARADAQRLEDTYIGPGEGAPAGCEGAPGDTSDPVSDGRGAKVNLLNWDANGRPDGLFPPRTPGRVSGGAV
ncbi:nitrate reductase subunit beta [Streptomyces kasugaensis]|uniref:Nitrate reductase subunit beta n=1 Tax=Streptomyces kasugaensis TaxID=1946 RepID=A0A4Q9HRH9_STRKA|nr:nitrate reductase subunit beta [Streptomyces kasugaensis]TBO57576.1 nitrate reductase subunit beta [Streptomyces kasugaensis]